MNAIPLILWLIVLAAIVVAVITGEEDGMD